MGRCPHRPTDEYRRRKNMIIIFFDAMPLILAAAVIIFGLVGALESIMPVLTVIAWILFGVVCIFTVAISLDNENTEGKVGRKIVNLILNIVILIILGLELNGFLSSVNEAAAAGGLSGMFEFVINIIFGGMGFLIIGTIFGAVSLWLCSYESDVPWGWRMAASVAAVIAYFVIAARIG